MSTLLLDASVWLAAVDTDDAFHHHARELIERSVERNSALAALDVTLYEVTAVALSEWGSPGDALRLAELVLAACPESVVRVDGELLAEAVQTAGERGIPVSEAANAVCARRRGWTVVSTDVARSGAGA